ncbi:homeobox protein BEL1 homolog [Ipomoea triloba]|uniref:homeobox protein BEL1 homolog n=1 Tax=Ipomoea triloba TaxID=35885 RepID=UPI00125D8F99|nr:homeobox protein BEL1 homolog [Ipomoea triloba]XP_031096193.1 homeobox protein BEL1 homolog [Ipomoea triloba]
MLCMAGQGEEKTRSAMVTTTGYWYADAPTNPQIHQIQQNFEPNPEIYNLTTGMEMIGWKSFFNKGAAAAACGGGGGGGPSSSKTGLSGEPSTSHEFYHQDFSTTSDTMMGGAPPPPGGAGGGAWVEDDPSLRCVFPCEGNERPSQGLSLSLSSSNPSAIGLQSFELRHHENDLRAPMMQHDGFLGKAVSNLNHPSETGYFQIRNSKYLGPAQDLLNEFCCLGTSADNSNHHSAKMKLQKTSQWQDENSASAASSSKKPSLGSLDLLELQKRKTKLLQMLEEVDRRYKHYCDQMKAVVSSFEAVAGNGAATVYSALASKAMSRHFRCLKDGIVAQIKAIKKATSEKDTVAPGTTKGETPRLRALDQALRQQRAFQQMTMMESHPWRPQRGLPERSVSVLRAWLFEHFLHPYPSDVDKHILARQTGLSRSQVSNWFINARVRLWKPMVEEMYVEETKEQENLLATSDDNGEGAGRNLQNPRNDTEDQKPNLVRIDSECISSIINNHPAAADDKNNASDQPRGGGEDDHHHQHHLHHQQAAFQIFGARGGGGDHQFGPVGMDFSSYSGGAAFSYAAVGGGSGGKSGGGGGGGVSLTLGLQQQGGNGGMGLAAAAASSSSLFYPRDQIEDCQTVPYSLLDSEGQNLPYRNLMGAQLLHDLAG